MNGAARIASSKPTYPERSGVRWNYVLWEGRIRQHLFRFQVNGVDHALVTLLFTTGVLTGHQQTMILLVVAQAFVVRRWNVSHNRIDLQVTGSVIRQFEQNAVAAQNVHILPYFGQSFIVAVFPEDYLKTDGFFF